MTSHSNDSEEALAAIEAKDYSTAFALLSVLAERGHPKAQCSVHPKLLYFQSTTGALPPA